MRGAGVHLIAIQFPGHVCRDDVTTERSFISQGTLFIDILAYVFDVLPMGVCTTTALADVRSTGSRITS